MMQSWTGSETAEWGKYLRQEEAEIHSFCRSDQSGWGPLKTALTLFGLRSWLGENWLWSVSSLWYSSFSPISGSGFDHMLTRIHTIRETFGVCVLCAVGCVGHQPDRVVLSSAAVLSWATSASPECYVAPMHLDCLGDSVSPHKVLLQWFLAYENIKESVVLILSRNYLYY